MLLLNPASSVLDPESSLHAIWMAHFTSVAFLCGLIWVIQCVHYPLMDRVPPERFREFHARHSSRITWIVAPTMLLELASGFWLFLRAPGLLFTLCLALSAVVFAATAFLAVPEHSRLAHGFDVGAHRRLVSRNWVRTGAWTLHLALCLFAWL